MLETSPGISPELPAATAPKLTMLTMAGIGWTRHAHEGKHEGKAVIQVREESTKTRFSRKVLVLRTRLFYLDQPHIQYSTVIASTIMYMYVCHA